MRFGSTAKVLAECKLEYYRISECGALHAIQHTEPQDQSVTNHFASRSCCQHLLLLAPTGDMSPAVSSSPQASPPVPSSPIADEPCDYDDEDVDLCDKIKVCALQHPSS